MSQTDTITVQVKDTVLTTAAMTFAIPVIAPISITVIDPLPPPTQGVPYSFQFSAIGGVPPYAWSLGGGAALAAGWPDPLPGGSIGAAYSYTLTATGGTPPYSYSVTAGTLPTGLGLNGATGLISGTPSVIVSLDAITLAVTDSSTGGGGGGGGQTGGNTYGLSVRRASDLHAHRGRRRYRDAGRDGLKPRAAVRDGYIQPARDGTVSGGDANLFAGWRYLRLEPGGYDLLLDTIEQHLLHHGRHYTDHPARWLDASLFGADYGGDFRDG